MAPRLLKSFSMTSPNIFSKSNTTTIASRRSPMSAREFAKSTNLVEWVQVSFLAAKQSRPSANTPWARTQGRYPAVLRKSHVFSNKLRQRMAARTVMVLPSRSVRRSLPTPKWLASSAVSRTENAMSSSNGVIWPSSFGRPRGCCPGAYSTEQKW